MDSRKNCFELLFFCEPSRGRILCTWTKFLTSLRTMPQCALAAKIFDLNVSYKKPKILSVFWKQKKWWTCSLLTNRFSEIKPIQFQIARSHWWCELLDRPSGSRFQSYPSIGNGRSLNRPHHMWWPSEGSTIVLLRRVVVKKKKKKKFILDIKILPIDNTCNKTGNINNNDNKNSWI